MDTAIIVSLIGGAVAVATAVYSARNARRATKERADQDARLARMSAEDSAYRRAEAFDVGLQQRMQAEINRQAGEIRALQRQVNRLSKQIREAGLVPVSGEEDQL